MDISLYIIVVVGTALVLTAAFTSLLAFRFGTPLLLIFLCIGLIAGVDGLGIDFDNAPVAYFVGSLALAVILFDSGFGTPLRALRQAATPALALSTFGVLITAVLMGVAAHIILGVSWLEGLLLGAIVGSTDAAAVFFLLRVGGVSIRDKVRSTLEIESGSNDPMAIFLTLTLVSALSAAQQVAPGALIVDILIGFLQQMTIGLISGLAGGWVIFRLTQRLRLERSLEPIFVIALSLMVFGLTGILGGSGFLAVYVAGLYAGNRLTSSSGLKRFQEGITWLAQIIMFLLLGLFATPSQFGSLVLPAVALGLLLMFVARPLAVALCLVPFRFQPAERAFISWVGLRGAVSILLALTPLIGNLEAGRLLFNVTFIIVVVSLLIQGWTIAPLANRLGLVVPPRFGPIAKHEVDLPGTINHELLAYKVTEESPVALGTRMPRWARPSLVIRDGRSISYQYTGGLRPGDFVYIFVPNTYPRLLDHLFASPAMMTANNALFFGDFTLDPEAPARELQLLYGAVLLPGEADLTLKQLLRNRLGGTTEYADRVSLGPVELIIRDADETGEATAIGLSIEPQTQRSILAFFLDWFTLPGLSKFLRRDKRQGMNRADQKAEAPERTDMRE